jgi:hypothetical protein
MMDGEDRRYRRRGREGLRECAHWQTHDGRGTGGSANRGRQTALVGSEQAAADMAARFFLEDASLSDGPGSMALSGSKVDDRWRWRAARQDIEPTASFGRGTTSYRNPPTSACSSLVQELLKDQEDNFLLFDKFVN